MYVDLRKDRSETEEDETKTILLVEDQAVIALIEKKMLEKSGYSVLTVKSGEESISVVRTHPIDLILMDIDLGRGKMAGTEAAQIILKNHTIPIIFLTSHADEKTVNLVKGISGYGYVLKNSGEFVLNESINLAFQLFTAHQKTLESEEKYRAAFMTSPDGLAITSMDGYYREVNENFSVLTGYTPEEVIGRTVGDISIWVNPRNRDYMLSMISEKGSIENLEASFRTKDGNIKTGLMSARVIYIDGRPYILSLTRDITEKKRIEEILRISEERLKLAAEGTADALWDYDLLNDHLYRSVRYNTMIGNESIETYSNREAWESILHPEDRKNAVQTAEDYFTGKTDKYESLFRLRRTDGAYIWIHDRGRAVWDEKGNPIRFLGFSTDITEQRELQEKEKRFKALFENTHDAIFISSIDDEILDVNRAACRMMGYTRDELLTLKTADLLAPERRGSGEGILRAELRDHPGEVFEGVNIRKDGKRITVEVSTTLIPSDTGDRVISIVRDVSDRKEMEIQLRESEERYRGLFESSPDGIVLLSMTGKIIDVNRAFYEMSGHEREDFVGKRFNRIPTVIHQSVPTYMRLFKSIFMDKGEKVYSFDWRHKSGERRTCEARTSLIRDRDNHRYIQATLRDITEEKRIEDILKDTSVRLQIILDSIPAHIFIADLNTGEILFANKSLRERFDHDIIGQPCYTAFRGFDAPCANCNKNSLSIKREDRDYINIWEEKSTEDNKWYLNYDRILEWTDKKPARLQISIDIDERKKQEELILKTVNEKDFLMRELNHRVKNNLLMVSSLINLKNAQMGEQCDISDLKYQVDTIRILYEKMQQQKSLTHINFREYVHDLLNTVLMSCTGESIECREEVEDIEIEARTAITMGLIVNEIATNAIKHGFIPGERGLFSISLNKSSTEHAYILILSNTGRPLPKDLNLEQPVSLGLRLVSSLIAQLEGSLRVEREPYPVFTIRFPIPKN